MVRLRPSHVGVAFFYGSLLEVSEANDISKGSSQVSISKSVNRRRGKDWWLQCLISILEIVTYPYIVM